MKALRITTVLTLVVASAAHAQLPSASTRALGMGDNATGAARGYAAVAWNPALLAVGGNPRASLALLPLRGVTGLAPVTLGDLSSYQGRLIPASVREEWITRIENAGNEQGSAGGDATYVAAQVGRFAFQLSSSARASGDLSAGAAELLFFGNAGRTGEARALDLSGSRINAHATSTAALSYAFPFRTSADLRTAFGITAKYTVGHVFMTGQDQGSAVTEDPVLNLRFPVVGTSTDRFEPDNGSGFGIDAGFAMQRGGLTIGATVQNLVNSFKWDGARMTYREGAATFDANAKESSFEERPLADAPANLRALVDDARFKPVIAAGVAYEMSPRLMLSTDFRVRTSETLLADQPKMHAGAGAEVQALRWLALRAGGAVQTGGYQIGGGIGVQLGPLSIAASAARRQSDGASDTITMFTLMSTAWR